MAPVRTIFELADAAQQGHVSDAFSRLYRLHQGMSLALATPQLVSKYGVDARSNQRVLCVQDLVRGTAAWYNQQRSRKPQTFEGPAAGGTAARAYDSTGPSKPCDFCNWEHLTAADPFGRCAFAMRRLATRGRHVVHRVVTGSRACIA